MSISGSSESTGSARVLLVNSNKSGLAARKAILEEVGHRVTAAANGEDAWEQLSKAGFDLVVTEYKMGRMNGVELIKKIRGLEPAIPVIMLSGYVEALGLTESTTGADVVLAKSANEVPQLMRAVSRLLRRKAKKPPGSKARATSQTGRRAS
jgi:CheY-like chemotaxis protein